jgi:hypothetical protein
LAPSEARIPLIWNDTIAGRTPAEIKNRTGAVHRAVPAVLSVPERDPYQIVNEHPAVMRRCAGAKTA